MDNDAHVYIHVHQVFIFEKKNKKNGNNILIIDSKLFGVKLDFIFPISTV